MAFKDGEISSAIKSESRDRKEWLLLLISLLVAFFIWLIHSLSLRYSVFMEYTVDLTTSIEGRANNATSEDVLIIRGRSDGYYILRQRMPSQSSIKVTLPPEALDHIDGDHFRVQSESVKSNIVEALGGNVDLEFIVTEHMDFTIPAASSKKVPIAVKSSITYKGQYMPMGDIILRPDSIEIFADAGLLGTIDSVFTETISRTSVDGPIQGLVDLVPKRRVKYSETTVYYSQNVVRYIEETVTVPVRGMNFPDEKTLIVLPTHVNLVFRRVFSSERYRAEDFMVVVDYDEYVGARSSVLAPKLVNPPEGLISWQFEPRIVDCVLLDNEEAYE